MKEVLVRNMDTMNKISASNQTVVVSVGKVDKWVMINGKYKVKDKAWNNTYKVID